MRTLSLLWLYFMVLVCQGSVSVPAPVNLYVSSNNFVHNLFWSPGTGTQPGTVYNVIVRKNRLLNIIGTSVDLTEYMKDIYETYEIKVWASFGNRSSSKAHIHFTPYTSTTIGPPVLSLSGCGDCLNISIELPKRHSVPDTFFYNAITFDIHWRKVSDEKEECHNPLARYESQKSMPYSYVLPHLEPGERYCVHVQPMHSSISKSELLSACACEFTARVEHRGVLFLVSCVVGSVLVGFVLLSLTFSLVYTGFLCKPNISLPKSLILLAPGYFLTPEETCVSVVDVEYGIQIHKSIDQHEKKKEKINNLCKNNDDLEEDDNDDDDDDDEGSHCGYMDRAGQSESESTGSRRSAPGNDSYDNAEGCGLEDRPTETKETSSTSLLKYSGIKPYSQSASRRSVTKNLNPLNGTEGKRLGGGLKKKDDDDDDDDDGVDADSENVNLWSVVLKSMRLEEEQTDEESEAKDPTLPLLLKDFCSDSLSAATPQTGRAPGLHTALSDHTHTHSQSSGDENEVSDHMRTGYMASHTGTIDTENCSSDDEEGDHMSGYMTR